MSLWGNLTALRSIDGGNQPRDFAPGKNLPGSDFGGSVSSWNVDPIFVNYLYEPVIVEEGRHESWSEGYCVVPPPHTLQRGISVQHYSAEIAVAQSLQERLFKARGMRPKKPHHPRIEYVRSLPGEYRNDRIFRQDGLVRGADDLDDLLKLMRVVPSAPGLNMTQDWYSRDDGQQREGIDCELLSERRARVCHPGSKQNHRSDLHVQQMIPSGSRRAENHDRDRHGRNQEQCGQVVQELCGKGHERKHHQPEDKKQNQTGISVGCHRRHPQGTAGDKLPVGAA